MAAQKKQEKQVVVLSPQEAAASKKIGRFMWKKGFGQAKGAANKRPPANPVCRSRAGKNASTSVER